MHVLTGQERAVQIVFRQAHRLDQWIILCQMRGNGGGQRASCAVIVARLYTRSGKFMNVIAIEEKIEGAIVEVTGGGGHFEIVATSSAFEGKGTLERQRLIYSAITHLMAGDLAPVHAVDKITSKTP